MSFFFLQPAHKQGNPSFHFHAPGSKRRYPCTQTASANPKYFPCRLQFCTGYRIWHCISSMKAKNERKTFIFTQLKISRYNPHFAIFRTNSYKLTSDLFTVVWPVHTLSLFFSWQQYAVFWHLSNFQPQNGQFCGGVSHICKDMVP